MKKIFITCAAILALFSSCTSVLDKEDLSSISEDKVWVDKTLTTAFLNALYVSIPSWDTAVADATDDTTAELHAAEAAFRDQRQQILPLYKQVMDWYR